MKTNLRSSAILAMASWSLMTISLGDVAKAASSGDPVKTVKGVKFVDPQGKEYWRKPDFARLEQQYPLSAASLQGLTPADLATWPQEALDQLYARLKSGPIPDGVYKGTVVIAKDGSFSKLWKVMGLDRRADDEQIVKFAQGMWKGKHFYRSDRALRNLIDEDTASFVRRIFGLVDGRGVVAGVKNLFSRSKAPKTQLEGTEYLEYFPAKLYCGQSLLDSRRESVIIDYAYGDDLGVADPSLEALAGRDGIAVRDEIRMVRPGFYLGRAYLQRLFVLNFTLYNEEVARSAASSPAQKDDCWGGEQAVARR